MAADPVTNGARGRVRRHERRQLSVPRTSARTWSRRKIDKSRNGGPRAAASATTTTRQGPWPAATTRCSAATDSADRPADAAGSRQRYRDGVDRAIAPPARRADRARAPKRQSPRRRDRGRQRTTAPASSAGSDEIDPSVVGTVVSSAIFSRRDPRGRAADAQRLGTTAGPEADREQHRHHSR